MGAASSVGIVGGGQLAWMLAEAARRRGVELHVQTPGAQDPAVALATSVVQADVRDVQATRELASRCSAISFENEWVDLDGLKALEDGGVCFVPALEALRPLVCKRSQRELLQRLNLPSPRWFPLEQAQAQALLRIFDIAPNGFLLSVDFFQPEVRKSHDDGSQEQQHSGQGRQHGKAVLPLRRQVPPPCTKFGQRLILDRAGYSFLLR